MRSVTRVLARVTLMLAAASSAGCSRETRAPLQVYAAISLTEPLQTTARRFETETGTQVLLNLSGSNTLATQILNGAPADVFLSADALQMDRVAQGGAIDQSTRRPFLGNRLVVIVPTASALHVSVPADLAGPLVRRFALADPNAVSAGTYALAYLSSRGVLASLEPRIVRFPHARAASTAVEQGVVDAGIVYRTDAPVAKGARVALEIDPDPRWDVVYPIAALRRGGAPASTTARAFIAFLERAENRRLFLDAGFTEPSTDHP